MKTIYSKTAKGMREASGKTRTLSRDLRNLLNEINGKSSVKDLLRQNDNWSEADLQKALAGLAEQGYIRDSAATSALEPAPTTAASPAKVPAPPAAAKEGGFDDLDFTAALPAAAGEAAAQATRLAEEAAKREAEERAKREAAERARREAEAQAQAQAQAQAKRQTEEAAKREAEERAKRQAAEQARREAEEKAKRQAEETAKREAEERAKREAAEQARRQAEERSQREAAAASKLQLEERVKREAAEKARREAEEGAKRLREAAAAAKREAEERAKREAAEQARREAEAQAKRQAEEAAKREAAERAKREAAEQARHEAEERAQREAAAAARREAEERAKREAAEQARREAEEKAKRQAEEAARREAEERAKREAADQARREAEEQTQREAAAAARREAEERAKREAAEQARREAEEKARRQAEEAARREAEEREKREAAEQALREVEERNKRQAEEAARRTAEEREKREAAERARREAEEEAVRQEAEERARQKADKQAQRAAEKATRAAASGPRNQGKWVKLSVIGIFVLAVLGLLLIHVISFDGQIPQLEKAAAEQFQQPVKIKSLHLSLMPPHWRLEGVAIGKSGQIKAPRIRALATLGSLFGEPKVFSAIEIDSPVLDEEGLGWLLFGATHGQGIRYGRLSATNAKLNAGGLELPALDVNADIGGEGNWQKMSAESADKKTSLELQRKGETVEIKLNAASFAMPFGPIPVLDDLSATGTARHGELAVAEFKGRLLGGMLSGRAKLKWGAQKTLDGELQAQRVEAARLLPGLFDGGELEGKAVFSLPIPEAEKSAAASRLDGGFVVRKGAIAGVDLARLLQGSSSGGRTQFAKLDGELVHDGGKTQVRQLRLEAGALSASGNVEVDDANGVRGQAAVELGVAGEHRRAAFALSGRLLSPYTRNIEWKRR